MTERAHMKISSRKLAVLMNNQLRYLAIDLNEKPDHNNRLGIKSYFLYCLYFYRSHLNRVVFLTLSKLHALLEYFSSLHIQRDELQHWAMHWSSVNFLFLFKRIPFFPTEKVHGVCNWTYSTNLFLLYCPSSLVPQMRAAALKKNFALEGIK